MNSMTLHSTLFMTLATLVIQTTVTPTPTNMTKTIKLATMMSLIPLLIFTNLGMESTTTNINWLNTNLNLQISFTLDLYTMMFIPVALFVTWSIMEFTTWYMASDPKLTRFAMYLLLFLMAMLTLITANNMLQLFIGWEWVGIMSFLLISWWNARTNAVTSALQAVIYNRIGDMGLIMTMAWLAMNYNTWDMQQVFSHSPSNTLPLLGLILAATGKSAQFGLHPWLPAAMEGPTPVSALLHSSTMVVAGVFLLIRLHPMLAPNQTALTLCLCLGALTTTFAAICALTQNDIKKIIAFSTSSQLGLMMLTLGMNQPKLAFLHITTHAFFKAMLFLCAGSIIHNLNDEQDIRKMGGMGKSMPITTACMTLGSLALAGTPFLAGFYTKDTIVETMNTSPTNAWALLTTMLATALTAAYSTRLIINTQLTSPRHPPYNTPTENSPNQTHPIIRLAIGSILSGLALTSLTLPNMPQTTTMPTLTKLLALVATILGTICAMDLAYNTTYLTTQQTSLNKTTTTQLVFFNTITHRKLTTTKMNLAQAPALQLNDNLWYEALGPMMIKTTNLMITKKLSNMHTGSIKTHLTTFMALLTTCLVLNLAL
uniref:NADH-ubiquinone oxidoreductase chain 5 n=1 Tax=Cyrtopodion scabrum TaxID=303590 RepID=A0A1Y1CC75_CYRSA|nr:NADH dehydrogenase subunit 5 [Cyrtopodion scabrum]BAX77920.1 HADA dehydrogenase subunit 5 [Cyrtopodion scabrum]